MKNQSKEDQEPPDTSWNTEGPQHNQHESVLIQRLGDDLRVVWVSSAGSVETSKSIDAELVSEMWNVLEGLVSIFTRAGNEKTVVQRRLIERLVYPEDYEFSLKSMKDLVVRFPIRETLRRGWMMVDIMQRLRHVVEAKNGGVLTPTTLIRERQNLRPQDIFFCDHGQGLHEFATQKKFWAPQTTLQSLARKICSSHTGVTEKQIEKDLRVAIEWSQRQLSDPKRFVTIDGLDVKYLPYSAQHFRKGLLKKTKN